MSSTVARPVGGAANNAGLYRRVQVPGGHQQSAAVAQQQAKASFKISDVEINARFRDLVFGYSLVTPSSENDANVKGSMQHIRKNFQGYEVSGTEFKLYAAVAIADLSSEVALHSVMVRVRVKVMLRRVRG